MTKVSELTVLKSMYYMMQSGIAPHEGASELALKIPDRKMSEKLTIFSDLMATQGHTFSQALEQVDLCREYLFVIQIGEKTGNLHETVRDVISSMESIQGIRKKIRSSLYYPVTVIVVSVLLGYFLVGVTETILGALSFPWTKDSFAYKWGWFLVKHKTVIYGIYVLVLAGAGLLIASNAHRAPVIKHLYTKISIGQAFRIVSLGLNSGLSPADALSHASRVVRGTWRNIFETISHEAQGRSMSDVLEEIEQYMSAETFIVLKAKVNSGSMSAGFQEVGKEYMASALQQMDSLSPFVSMVAFFFVAFQIGLIMGPIGLILISFINSVTGSGPKGGF